MRNTNNLILKHYLAMMIMQRRAFKSLGLVVRPGSTHRRVRHPPFLLER